MVAYQNDQCHWRLVEFSGSLKSKVTMDLDLSVWEYTYGVYIAANSVSNIVVSMASISSHRTLPGLVCES